MPDVAADDPLAAAPLFASIAPRERKRLARDMREHTVDAGRTLTAEGEGGIAFFVILEGEAEVSMAGKVLRRLGPGDHAGEVALLDMGSRTATITATTDLRCLALTAWKFPTFVRENPEVAWALLVSLAGRVRDAQIRAAQG
jgi:CRP-like cAMP-binding protein